MKYRFHEDGEEKEIDLTDEGSDVHSSSGRVIGKRGYTQFNGSRPVPVTHYPDGGSNVHCGGPCGDLYVDKFGNT